MKCCSNAYTADFILNQKLEFHLHLIESLQRHCWTVSIVALEGVAKFEINIQIEIPDS